MRINRNASTAVTRALSESAVSICAPRRVLRSATLGRVVGVTMVVLIVSLLIAAALAAKAQAATFTVVGSTLRVEGVIERGDDAAFSVALTNDVRTVELNSKGGWVGYWDDMGNVSEETTIRIARLIRARHLKTVVDASRELCQSACVVLFTAGTVREYRNAPRDTVVSRVDHTLGLAVHVGIWTMPDGFNKQQAWDFSGPATGEMVDCFYEMGAPHAALLMMRSDPQHVLRVSGREAVANGIATELH